MRIVLTVTECQVTGELGFLPNGLRHNGHNILDSGTGTLLAHDIVEHQQGFSKIGGFEDELIALGAMWITRGQWDDINRPNSGYWDPVDMLASDITNLQEYITRPWQPKKTRQNEFDYAFEQAIENTDDVPSDQYDCILSWLRTGARMQERRFGKFINPGLEANNAFWNIVHAIKNGPDPEFEGQQFVLKSRGWHYPWVLEEDFSGVLSHY